VELFGKSLALRVELPKLVCVTKSGKELYQDPLTGEATSREIAFAGFESLKNNSEERVYRYELSRKNQGDISQPQINVAKDSKGVTIVGCRKHQTSYDELSKPVNIFDKSYQKYLKHNCPQASRGYDELTNLPYAPFPLFKTIRNVFDKKNQWLDDEEKDLDVEKEGRHRGEKKKLFILA
jgi:hypothetical protein